MTYEDALFQLAERDPYLLVMTAENRAAIRNLPARLGSRFIDVGICEQTMIGMAAGLALRGRTPVVHALAAFLTMRAFEFIRTDVGIAGLPVKLVGYVPGFLSEANGPTHQAIEDIALMRTIPKLEIYCPPDAAELVRCLPDFVGRRVPAYMRYCTGDAFANPFQGGRDVAILTYGLLSRQAVRAADLLSHSGYEVRVVVLRTLRPFDDTAVLDAARDCAFLVTLEDHFRIGGLYSIVAELLLEQGVRARVHRIALEDRWFCPALLDDVLAVEGFDASGIAERIRRLLN
jgi:transketolase